MDSHPIENLMRSTMSSIKDMVDVNTIVGKPVESYDGTLIVPISKVSFGFASGGSEFSASNSASESNSKYPFGGGSGAGVTIKPVAFLVVKPDSVRVLSMDHQNTYDKLVDTVPQVMDTLKGMLNSKKENKEEKEVEEEY